MSIGPLIPAASPLAQTKGGEVERSQEEVRARARRVYHQQKAEAAGGIGQPDGEDHETHDRTADGRRPWDDQPLPEANAKPARPRQSRDPTGQSGSLLDLTG